MQNLENLLTYSSAQWDIVSHVLALGYAAHAAGFVYFLLTINQVKPKYRSSSILSVVVMVSAFFILYKQAQNWEDAFVWDQARELWVRGTSTFSNGYRYVNWSIDVPCLLAQLVVVLGLSQGKAQRVATGFVIGGWLMIYTGYIGQFYETSATSMSPFYIWFAVSTVFYLYLLYLVFSTINRYAPELPPEASSGMHFIKWWILGTWSLYLIAYLIPAFWPTGSGVVTRQIVYTVADITSKVFYGVFISWIAVARSKAEGYEPAIAASPEE